MKANFYFLLLIGLILTACSGESPPRLIAAYPSETTIATYPRPQHQSVQMVYTDHLELEVKSVDRAAERVREIAYEQGGYLVNTQSWYQVGEKHIMLEMVVPADRFDASRRALLRLGQLVSERNSGELVPPNGVQWDRFSEITVYLLPESPSVPKTTLLNWHPAQTFIKAWDVFLSIFGFILDAAIWITVVAGPFMLIGWGIRKFLEYRRKKAGIGTEQGSDVLKGK